VRTDFVSSRHLLKSICWRSTLDACAHVFNHMLAPVARLASMSDLRIRRLRRRHERSINGAGCRGLLRQFAHKARR
jgi:hypothetical protein